MDSAEPSNHTFNVEQRLFHDFQSERIRQAAPLAYRRRSGIGRSFLRGGGMRSDTEDSVGVCTDVGITGPYGPLFRKGRIEEILDGAWRDVSEATSTGLRPQSSDSARL